VANVVAFDDVKATRIERALEGGKFAWRTNFMQPDAEDRENPQAFLAECSPERVLPTHFHDHDQFQIFVSGGGTNGKHPIAPFQVHFSRKHTPYGPIVANEQGCGFLTLRAQRDPGAQYLPENLDKLKGIEGRQPWQHSVNVEFPHAAGGMAVSALEGIRDDRGLAAHAISIKANAEGIAPDPANSDGQYIVVLGGSLVYEGREHAATTIVWVRPDEGAFRLLAGSRGLEAVALHFPRPELPISETASSAAGADADSDYKVWQCVLCAFVYDEAAGLPEEGIAPGTRWADVPESWGCPDCSAKKADFEMVEF
jgi:rubredoxin